MKKQYTAPNANVIVLEGKDILTSSGWGKKPTEIGDVEDL